MMNLEELKAVNESEMEKYTKQYGTIVEIFYSKRTNEYTVFENGFEDRTYKKHSSAIKRIKALGAIVEE